MILRTKVDTWHVQPEANPGDFSARSAYVVRIWQQRKKKLFIGCTVYTRDWSAWNIFE